MAGWDSRGDHGTKKEIAQDRAALDALYNLLGPEEDWGREMLDSFDEEQDLKDSWYKRFGKGA
jgi:hypothetical protein